jgi:hypothetical protein
VMVANRSNFWQDGRASPGNYGCLFTPNAAKSKQSNETLDINYPYPVNHRKRQIHLNKTFLESLTEKNHSLSIIKNDQLQLFSVNNAAYPQKCMLWANIQSFWVLKLVADTVNTAFQRSYTQTGTTRHKLVRTHFSYIKPVIQKCLFWFKILPAISLSLSLTHTHTHTHTHTRIRRQTQTCRRSDSFVTDVKYYRWKSFNLPQKPITCFLHCPPHTNMRMLN